MNYKVPFIKPSFPSAKDLMRDYETIVESNWYTNYGPYEQKFRKEIKTYLNLPVEVCTVANATLGLTVAAEALFLKDSFKKKVLIPSFTFTAGAGVLVNMGFEPVFIDIDSSWQPDLVQAEDYLKKHNDVVGILLCNVFGVGNQKITSWEKLAIDHNLPLIIDSAAGFGSRYSKAEHIGGRGDCEIFSLHATKPFGVGEGGLILSKNKELIEKCRSLTNFGFDNDRKVIFAGTNAKLQEISCAIGIRQLRSLKKRLDVRQKSLEYYKKQLQPHGFLFQPNDELSTVPFVSVMALSKNTIKEVSISMDEAGIEHKHYYDPLHTQPAFNKYQWASNLPLETTDFTVGRIVSLPLHDNMNKSTIDMISSCIIRAV